jgi:DNA adenine methylase
MEQNKSYNILEFLMDSLISWIGGKKQLRAVIAGMIPCDINGYIEPFGGAGWVLFYKDRWAKLEVYNDIDARLTNLFLVAKFHKEELHKELQLMLSSRFLFEEIISQPGLTDIQRAARFLFIIKRSFGAKGEHYGTSKKGNATRSLNNMTTQVMSIADRLDNVNIETKDYKEIFEMYDLKENFFFLDPPYRHGVQYKPGRMNYEIFLKELKKLKGRFLLTIDDCPENLKLFKDYNIKKIDRCNGINRKQIVNNRYMELIITNYE